MSWSRTRRRVAGGEEVGSRLGKERRGCPQTRGRTDGRAHAARTDARRFGSIRTGTTSVFTRAHDEVVEARGPMQRGRTTAIARRTSTGNRAHCNPPWRGSRSGSNACCWRSQTRRWQFDLEEGVLDAARLARVRHRSAGAAGVPRGTDADFKDTVVTILLDNSGSMRGRPDHGGGALRRRAGAHARTLRREGRNPRLHDARMERRPFARGLAAGRAAGGARAAERPALHRLQAGRRAVATRRGSTSA